MNNGLGIGVIDSMAIDPTQPYTFYAGGFTGKLYKTTDGGATWFSISVGLSEDRYNIIMDIDVDPSDSLTVYAATNNNVYKSVDGGVTWNSL